MTVGALNRAQVGLEIETITFEYILCTCPNTRFGVMRVCLCVLVCLLCFTVYQGVFYKSAREKDIFIFYCSFASSSFLRDALS